MPIDFLAVDYIPKSRRASKIEKSPDWTELQAAIQKGLPSGKAIRVTFSEDTKKIFKKEEKAAQAFIVRLRSEYKNLRSRLIGGQIFVSTLEKGEQPRRKKKEASAS